MPPNLGGFFMVRSYYPSECHADYFDFERIEALKPAIEACGISTLSQDRKSGSAGMPRPISYAVFCLKKKTVACTRPHFARIPSWASGLTGVPRRLPAIDRTCASSV